MAISKEMMKAWTARFNAKYAKPKTEIKKPEPEPEVVETKPVEPDPVPVAEPVAKAKAKPKRKAKPKKTVAVKKARVEPPKTETETDDPKELKAVKDVIKSIQKTANSEHNNYFTLQKVRENAGEKFCTDSYRIIVTLLKGIEKEADDEGFRYKGCFPEFYEGEMESPTVPELKALWKTEKEKYKAEHGKGTNRPPMYVFENGLAINIKYLIDGITATGSTKFQYLNNKSPILFESENGKTKYLVCPINNPDKKAGCHMVA